MSDFNTDMFAGAQVVLDTSAELKQLMFADDVQPGLHRRLQKNKPGHFVVNYRVGDVRPYMRLDKYPELTVNSARMVAKLMRALAEHGVDPQKVLR